MQVEEISSKSNDHEASFLIMLARHLILQEYKPEQVTILTTYNGQMFELRSVSQIQRSIYYIIIIKNWFFI